MEELRTGRLVGVASFALSLTKCDTETPLPRMRSLIDLVLMFDGVYFLICLLQIRQVAAVPGGREPSRIHAKLWVERTAIFAMKMVATQRPA